MIEGFKKTKASKLWFPMVIMFVLILNISSAEAKSLKKGEEFKGEHGGAIRVVSSDEVEIELGGEIYLGKYTIDGERVRIVITTLGTMVRYYKIIPDGLVEEKEGTIYYSKAALAALKGRIKRAEEEQRKALAAGARKYKDNRNGTVTDNDTKLVWQQGEGGQMNWDSAIASCKQLSLAGYNDWRLPNLEELKTIIDVGKRPAINKTNFPDAKSSNYWSSTTYAGYTADAWGVDFDNGNSGYDFKTSSNYVRCVRGGQ